jgi:site-specific DNA recombinase
MRSRSVVEPISNSGLHKMLSNRYYVGYLSYCGVEYKGRHQPLATPSTFAAVQSVRVSHTVRDSKHRSQFHYLSRLMHCAMCQRYLCYTVAKRKYGYFFCMSRDDKKCLQPYIPARLIEEAVLSLFTNIKIPISDRKILVSKVAEELDTEKKFAENDLRQQKQRHDRLHAEQENLMQAFYGKVITPEILKKEQKRILENIKQAESVIKEASARLLKINTRHAQALKSAETLNLAKAYKRASPAIKRHFSRSFFSEILVSDERKPKKQRSGPQLDHNVTITEVRWHEPMNVRLITEAILALSLKSVKD